MIHSQTAKHRPGKGSYHQIGLVRGQFGDYNKRKWIKIIAAAGFDGYEEAAWELTLPRCDTDDGAEAYAKELVDGAREFGLEIFTVATHLQGQALGDEPSTKTLQFVGGEAVKAYTDWRASGNEPPRTNPYFVPDHVGAMIHDQAKQDLIRAVRLAHYLGQVQNRTVAMSSFVGSPANRWSHFFGFPPLPSAIGGHAVPNVHDVSRDLLIERFKDVWDECDACSIPFGLECHPSEFAIGDMASAREFLQAVDEAGFENTVGFNFDASHMLWQGVDPIEFIREFSERICSVHLKGVWVSPHPTHNGLLGGHRPMSDPRNGWKFVTAGCDSDCIPEEQVIVALNEAGYDGALNIEWEDNRFRDVDGAKLALKRIREIDLAPSGKRHDETLKA